MRLAFTMRFFYTIRMISSPQVAARNEGGTWVVSVGGQWTLETPLPDSAAEAINGLTTPGLAKARLVAVNLGHWDSSLLVFLVQLIERAEKYQLPVELELPVGLDRLARMAFAVPPRAGANQQKKQLPWLARVGEATLALGPLIIDFLNFLGEVSMGMGRLVTGKSRMRLKDLVSAMYECGILSLPIISLTSMLFGLILAFIGAVQLKQFGAQIYVAGLVGIGMLRVMGAVMVGVVMSGRIGAAYAALIGTMQVNEEIDALKTIGISPVDFLVAPRILALTTMVPALTIYADLMGILGGFIVGTIILGLNPLEYLHATQQMVHYKQILVGLVYGAVFGIVIAITGCYQGMRCGRSALAVGQTTTKAVVSSIVGIIIMTAIITIICNVIGV